MNTTKQLKREEAISLIVRCQFCKEPLAQQDLKGHEKVCLYNPKNKTCYTCGMPPNSPGCIFGYKFCGRWMSKEAYDEWWRDHPDNFSMGRN